MTNEIKTEDIIKSLRVCASYGCCKECILEGINSDCCYETLPMLAADRLEQLTDQLGQLQARFAQETCDKDHAIRLADQLHDRMVAMVYTQQSIVQFERHRADVLQEELNAIIEKGPQK